MKIQTFINEFKLTFVYDLLRQTLTDEQLFEHVVEDGQVIWFKEQMRQMWHLWTTAAAEEVPEGFALVKVEEIKTWYLDDLESIYREDPDWLCDIPVGEVVEVERRISYELNQDPVFAAIEWEGDEKDGDEGYYKIFTNREDAEKAAAHCKAMKLAQELSHDKS